MHKIPLLLVIAFVFFRCQLHAQGSSVLPVLVTLDARVQHRNNVIISWTLLARVNTAYFEVRKSNDGINWRTVVTVKADENTAVPTTYSAIDKFPLQGSNFYQVRLSDRNGFSSVTSVRNVRIAVPCSIVLFPNPASSQITVCLGQLPRGDWNLSLVNDGGRVLEQKKFSSAVTSAIIPVSQYPTGNYLLEIQDGNTLEIKKLMINHR